MGKVGRKQSRDATVFWLFGQCNVVTGSGGNGAGLLGNIADADLDSWPRAVRALTGLPASVVIPGHGDRLDPNLIQSTLDVLAKAKGSEAGQKQARWFRSARGFRGVREDEPIGSLVLGCRACKGRVAVFRSSLRF
jgi:hypothetical protein